MQIEKIDIDKIKMYENNAKQHSDWQIEQIKNRIQEFGFNDPIAVDENNVIIEGHGRLIALKELNYKEVDVIRLNHLTEEQKSAYSIAHNKLTNNTYFDMDKLRYELNKLELADFDLTILGFENIELEEIMEVNSDETLEIEDEEAGNEKTRHKLICPHCRHTALKSEFKEVMGNGEDT